MAETQQLEGEVEHIVYHNDDTGFTVLELNVGGELYPVVGEFYELAEGESVVLHGTFGHHATYGMQFKSVACERKMPSGASAILKYLSGGAIRGIGPATARRIVDRFGDETLTVIEKQPQLLAELSGISSKKAAQIAEHYQQINGIRSVLLYLARFGIDAAVSIRIFKLWGVESPRMIEENPYRLCEGEVGLPFSISDEIAASLEHDAESPQRLVAGICFVLRENGYAGHTCLPRERLAPVAAKMLDCDVSLVEWAISKAVEDERLTGVTLGGREYIYENQSYLAERYIASRIALLNLTPPSDEQCQGEINAIAAQQGLTFAPEQVEGIRAAVCHSLSVLTGGPGTGKTTTLNAIIRLFEERKKKVALCAPTGRAAKRMSDMTGKEAKTIHRLLEVDQSDPTHRRFRHNEQNTLGFDVIILDEVSMVDTQLFYSLLRAIRLSCKLVLVGDADQLPSVSAGNVLRDLIESGQVHTTRLKEIFRQARSSLIVVSAHEIVSGRVPNLEAKDNDFFFLGRQSDIAARDTVGELCKERLPAAYSLDPFSGIQVIAPTRVGALGTNALNRHLQELLNPGDPKAPTATFLGTQYRVGDKVMQVKNNYDITFQRPDGSGGAGVFNGDIGVIEDIDRGSRTLFIRFDERLAEYSFDLLEQLELAYAITVHKSQGSEFPAVVIPLAGYRSKMHFRNLLYTAVTRARRLLILVGTRSTVEYMVQNNLKTVRYTGLCELLTEAAEGML